MNSITWITPDYFLDSDLNPNFIKLLSESFDIHWIVVFPLSGRRYKESDFDIVKSKVSSIKIDFYYIKHRQRNPLFITDIFNIKNLILKQKSDLIYLNMAVGDPYLIPLVYSIPANKTIITAHQGKVHTGMSHKTMNRVCRYLVYKRLRNVNMFSKSQYNYFKDTFKESKVFLNPLGVKYFGKAKVIKEFDSPIVRFLSFGIINYAKNLELLIDAAEELYNEGEHGFVVSINGGCNNWQFYADRIKHPDIFETDIRLIPNDLLPDLFTKSHFFVQPYRVVSQSGPLKIAYAYNTPVIVSDLPGFTDEVEDGVSGYIFEHNNLESLKSAMRRAIDCYRTGYDKLQDSMRTYVYEHYSDEKMAEKYLQMFNTVINDEK